MCGLVATVSFDGQPAEPQQLRRMADTLAHRGPDDSGILTHGAVGLGFRRLAILDLSPAGHQPMESDDGRLSIVFNGEIYNYLELKEELQQLGHCFRSSCDTEVLLRAYQHWGASCVERFNGMWAFVIYDAVERRLFASRDRFGVKPLYRWSDGKRLVFASEIKAIVASGWYRPDVNWQSAARFLCRGHLDESEQTFFTGVEHVPPGSTMEVGPDGRTSVHRFWSLDSTGDEPPADPVARFRELFEDSIRLRMRSDVPVGVCLSGGIDSNAIISMMAALRSQTVEYPLQAFSYIPEEFSEADYIHESVAKTGAVLNELHTDPRELWDLLPKALWHYDEPIHSPTALIGFQLMGLARSRGVTVVLNGQGADEVNAGYHGYFKPYWTDLMRAGRWAGAVSEISAYSAAHRQSRWLLLRHTAAHWLRTELRKVPGYVSLRGRNHAEAPAAYSCLSADFVASLPPRDPDVWAGSLGDTLAHSVEHRPLPLYLRVEDRNSMAHSVEARVPFLDYRLVRLAFTLPAEWKLRGPWNKYVVREAMKGVIAERVRTRLDKMGFPTPGRYWLSGPWYEPVRDLIAGRTLRESGICNVETALDTLDRHKGGTADAAGVLFHLAEFAVWLQSQGAHSPAPPLKQGAADPSTIRLLGATG